MSVNGDAARRDMWAGRIERCLASGMAIGQWCSLSKVNKSSLYRWLAVFRDERLGRFAGKNSEAFGWGTAMRDDIAVTKAVVPAVSAADPAEETPGSKDWRSGKPLGSFRPKGRTPRGLSFYMAVLAFADVSAVVAFVVAWAFASSVASAVAGRMLATSASERAIEGIADAGCFMA